MLAGKVGHYMLPATSMHDFKLSFGVNWCSCQLHEVILDEIFYLAFQHFVGIVCMTLTCSVFLITHGTERPIFCWCAVKQLLTHSLAQREIYTFMKFFFGFCSMQNICSGCYWNRFTSTKKKLMWSLTTAVLVLSVSWAYANYTYLCAKQSSGCLISQSIYIAQRHRVSNAL